tara:strand:+ start:3944 stop:4732 length:789 start_codon:yes stop_codon:yes gene_type:complete
MSKPKNELASTTQNFLVSDEYKPELVVERGVQIAQVLTDLIARSKLYHRIPKIKGLYVSTEGWQATCSMMRVFPREVCNDLVLEAKYDEAGKQLHGVAYDATVELTRPDGFVVSRASARCGGPDDRPWDKRSAQAIKSMAGTRAFNKAARLVFGWIVKAKPGHTEEGEEISFEATPGEEMEAAMKNDDRHIRQTTTIPPAPGGDEPGRITKSQLLALKTLTEGWHKQDTLQARKNAGLPESGELSQEDASKLIGSIIKGIKQ